MHYESRTFSLPEVPGISTEQLAVHVGLYEGYVKHVNTLYNELTRVSAPDSSYAVTELRRRLGFEFNGMRLHELYFEQLEGGAVLPNAEMKLYGALKSQYGSFEKWLDEFKGLAGRGPGWAILNYDKSAKCFHNVWVADHEVGQLATLPALLVIDHWEHAYMVDYKPAEKSQYVDAYVNALNWSTVAARFDEIG